MATLHITPTGSGLRDGSSAANAASIWSIDKMIDKAGPGGTVLVHADQGSYDLKYFLSITNGGSVGNPVTVKGVDAAGNAMNAEFTGTRATHYSPTAAVGIETFRLLSGADHLTFENMSFANVQNAFRVGSDIADLSLAHMTANNVQRFFEDYASTASRSATISGLQIENVDVSGYSKGAIRLQYDTHDVIIDDMHGDSKRLDGDDFAMGVMLGGTVHDVVIKQTSMMNSTDTLHPYWNGDGFAAEKDVYNLLFEDTYAAGNTDAGYDLKSQDTVLLRAVSEDNNRNFRVWGDGVTIIDSQSIDPHHRGGTGGQAHVHLAPQTNLTIIGSTLIDNSAKTVAIDLSEEYARVTLVDTDIMINDAARLLKQSKGSGALNGDGSKVEAQDYDAALATLLRAASGPEGSHLPPPSYAIASRTASVIEGNSGAVELLFTVSREGDVSKAGHVVYGVSGSGPNGANAVDFKGGVLPEGEIGFSPGETSKTIAIGIRGDKTVEADEGFQVVLKSVSTGTIANARAGGVILNDDIKPVIFTLLDKQHAIDVSAAGNQTVTGTAAHDSFYVDVAARSGKDVIAEFGRSDVLLTTKRLYDGNDDGIVTANRMHTIAIDGFDSADTMLLKNGVDALRSLGKTEAGLHVYADAGVKPTGAIESRIGDETLSGSGIVKKATTFFFDNALDIDLGRDTIVKFGARDLIVTTAEIASVNGKISVDQSGRFALPGGSGGADDSYVAGEGGKFAVYNTAGKAVTALEFDGQVRHDGINYYVYSQMGSEVDKSDLLF